ETIEDGSSSVIQKRPEVAALAKGPREIRDGHHPRKHESDGPREQAQDHQQPSGESQGAGEPVECQKMVIHPSKRKAEESLHSMPYEYDSHGNAQRAEQERRPLR